MPTCGDLNAVQAISVPGMADPRFDIFCQPELSSTGKVRDISRQDSYHLTLIAKFLNGIIRQLAIDSQLDIGPLHQVTHCKP